jgi:type I restriction enzyme, S subunit
MRRPRSCRDISRGWGMSEDWERHNLKDCVEFYSGTGFSERFQGSTQGEIPFYKVSDMSIPGNERLLTKANNYVSEILAEKKGWRVVPQKSIVFAKVGAALLLNRRRITSRPSLIDNNMMALRPKPMMSTEWLFRQMCRVDFPIFVQDGAVPSVNQNQIGELHIRIPEEIEQSAITRILDTLDSAIQETESLIEKLKAIKQGLLHDLLTRGVDENGKLRPPREEAPQLYKESELGWIPKEWEICRLGEHLQNKPSNGYSPQEGSEWTGTAMLGLGCLTLEGFVPRQIKIAPPRDVHFGDAILRDFDILMSCSNTFDLVGLAGIYRDIGSPCIYPDLMMRLIPKQDLNHNYLDSVLRYHHTRRQIQNAAVGTSSSMMKISGHVVSNLLIPFPDMPEQIRICKMMEVLQVKVDAEKLTNSKTIGMKKALMDDLLTGRVRVTSLLAAHPELGQTRKVSPAAAAAR